MLDLKNKDVRGVRATDLTLFVILLILFLFIFLTPFLLRFLSGSVDEEANSTVQFPETHRQWAQALDIEEFEYEYFQGYYETYELMKGTLAIAQVSGGAYQSAFMATYFPHNQNEDYFEYQILEFYNPIFDLSDDMMMELSFDADKNEFHFFNKGRGLADCGSSGLYGWQEGNQPELLEYFNKDECDGKYDENWPQIYP